MHASTDVRWQELPDGIVGVVVYLDPPYRRIVDGHDWIWLADGEFRAKSTHATWGRWKPKPKGVCGACVKRGAAMPDDLWAGAQRAMLEAREAP